MHTCKGLVTLAADLLEVALQRLLGLLKGQQFLLQHLHHALFATLMLLQTASQILVVSHKVALNWSRVQSSMHVGETRSWYHTSLASPLHVTLQDEGLC